MVLCRAAAAPLFRRVEIGGDVHLSGHMVEGRLVKTAPVRLRDRVTVSGSARLGDRNRRDGRFRRADRRIELRAEARDALRGLRLRRSAGASPRFGRLAVGTRTRNTG